MSQNPPRALSFSFRGCLWSSGFLKTLHSKPVIFLVYALKETDGEKPQGEKANKVQPSPMPASWCYYPIRIGPQMAWKWDRGCASGQTQAGHRVSPFVTPQRTKEAGPPLLLDLLQLTPLLGSLSCQLCVLSSEESADCSVPYKVSSFVVHKAFSSCLTQSTKTFLLSQDYWTSAYEEHQGLAKGMYIWEEISWAFARQGTDVIATQRAS